MFNNQKDLIINRMADALKWDRSNLHRLAFLLFLYDNTQDTVGHALIIKYSCLWNPRNDYVQ